MSRYLTILVCFLMALLFPTYLRANEMSLQLLGPREVHLSNIVDGVSTITGKHRATLTEQLLPKNGCLQNGHHLQMTC